MQSRIAAILLITLLTAAPAYATDYVVSDQASCEALPVPTTWNLPFECQLDGNLTLSAGDVLEVQGPVDLLLPPGHSITNLGGLLSVPQGGEFRQRGTLENAVGGRVEMKGFWSANGGATIQNQALSIINFENQLFLNAELINFGILQINRINSPTGRTVLSILPLGKIINWGSVINDGGNIELSGRVENNALMTNNSRIVLMAGTLENNATLINNSLIKLESAVTGSRLENNATLTNNGSIILDCPSNFQNVGTFIGNPVDIPYCINGGNWSDPGAWNKNAVPPSDARIIVESGSNHLDIDLDLSGSLLIDATLQIDSGSELEILAAGEVTISSEFPGNGLIINNHSLINRGELVNRGRILNNADFGNEGAIRENGLIENHGLFQNTSAFMQSGILNHPDGIMDNAGFWKMNRFISHNRGEFRIRAGGELELNLRLRNEGGGVIENFGLLTINDGLTGSNGSLTNGINGLIINHPDASLNLTSADEILENEGETRNEGSIGNNGTINNPGRICGSGDIIGNVVIGNAPEPTCNRAPTAVALPDAGLLECTGPTTNVSLDGRLSSDPDLRDELTYSWSPAAGLIDPTAALTSGNVGLGSKNYTLTVMDLLGESDSDVASFTVRDTTAPAMTCPADITLVADDMCIGTGDPTLAQALDVCDTNPSVTRVPAGSSWSLGDNEVLHIGTDGSGNTAVCASTVEVVDETIPAIQCNTDGVFVRPGMPVSFQATATDNCSVASVSVTAFDCWEINPSGRRVDKTGKCEVVLSGDIINIVEPSGVGTIIGWTVDAVDGSGNAATASCEVVSTRPNRN